VNGCEVANLVVRLLVKQRDDWTGQGAAFCDELYSWMREMLNNRHKDLGARVRRPPP
jgi:hypothetical protein